ncbi:MCE family protein [Pseudonocardia xishanensis]|uniref:Phospholipid/cholesterol/gamma-HCH transport system substrate-binding protein n=1 Tax=Pseudonocardia xishanensis TaxID=630995 RepID=A0ABP8RTG4_9PSEU
MARLGKLAMPVRFVAVAVVLALVAGAVVILLQGGVKHGTAYFRTVKNIYPQDRVKIQGVDVGRIESITPEADKVRVEFTYDSKYDLPADAGAAVVTPTLVATRFLQIAPAYKGGEVLEDGGVIPLERTASPLEFDDLKKELSKVATQLGPDGLDPQGALNRFLRVSAENGDGRGAEFNTMIQDASAAMQTLADGREDLFGTVKNLQVLVTALSGLGDQITEFNTRLDDVSGIFDENRDQLAQAISGIDQAGQAIDEFVRTNGDELNTTVERLGQFNGALAAQRDDLAQILHVAPNTLQAFLNVFSPTGQAVTGTLTVNNLDTPADFVCSAFAAAAAHSAKEGTDSCVTTLGPLLNLLRIQQPPIGVNPISRPGGGLSTDRPGEVDRTSGTAPSNDKLVPSTDIPGLGGLLTGGN